MATADAGTGPAVWIDARRPAAAFELWGMNLVERQLRQLALLDLTRTCVWLGASGTEGLPLRPDLRRIYSLENEFTAARDEQVVARLQVLEAPLLWLRGDVVHDERVLQHLLHQGPGHLVGSDGIAALFLTSAQATSLAPQLVGESLSVAQWNGQGLSCQAPEELDPYVAALRLTMPPFMLQLQRRVELRAADRLLYRRTFKGVIDAVARYGYYHLVRWITRGLSRTSLPPNLFTIGSIIGIWAAVPCFALGYIGWGLAAAWSGVILDSIDGKLARLTLHLSDAMGAFEHIAAMPGLGMWYFALGWFFSGGQLVDGSSLSLTTWSLVGAFLADKMLSGLFKKVSGREIFDYRPLDAAFHLIASRRNISLAILSLGALLDRVEQAFVLMALWMGITFVFHALRFAWAAREGFAPARDLGLE